VRDSIRAALEDRCGAAAVNAPTCSAPSIANADCQTTEGMKRMLAKNALVTLATSVIATTSFAQTIAKPDGQWRGGVGLSAAVARGNTETTNLGLNADVVRQTTIDKIGFYLQDIYGTSKNSSGQRSTSAQIFRLGGKYDRDINEKLYGFGAFDYEHDKLAGVKQRLLPQAGVGIHIVKSEAMTFDAFAGIAYNHTMYYVDPTTRDTEVLLGEESVHKISATTSFKQRLAMYAPYDDLSDARTQFDAGLTTVVIGGWNLVVNYTFRHNNAPPTGKKKSDSLLFTGLQYSWGPK
jgi:putative salt-induced outer membrane protein